MQYVTWCLKSINFGRRVKRSVLNNVCNNVSKAINHSNRMANMLVTYRICGDVSLYYRYKIFLIDHGGEVWVPTSNAFSLEPKFLEWPTQAIRVSLAGK